MGRIKACPSSKLFEELPHIKKIFGGSIFFGKRPFYATADQKTEEIIKACLEYYFKTSQNNDFKVGQNKVHHFADTYPGFRP